MKPEILTHPHIPKPLHGLNPRTLLGTEWWNKTRFKAQARTNYTCAACGVEKQKAKKYKWLEGHEYWKIDYNTGICEVVSIEPLCHYCHNFIHSGRLLMIMGKEKTRKEVVEILEHGFGILSKYNLKAFSFTLQLAKEIKANTFDVNAYYTKFNPHLKWGDFCLLLEGKKYYSKFEDQSFWAKYYSS